MWQGVHGTGVDGGRRQQGSKQRVSRMLAGAVYRDRWQDRWLGRRILVLLRQLSHRGLGGGQQQQQPRLFIRGIGGGQDVRRSVRGTENVFPLFASLSHRFFVAVTPSPQKIPHWFRNLRVENQLKNGLDTGPPPGPDDKYLNGFVLTPR